jgi:hypothetical protein
VVTLSRTRTAKARPAPRGRALAVARQTVPLARSAQAAARRGGQNAATWAAPRLYRTRAWAAPRIERGGLAFQDTVAPKISGMLTAAARKLDVTPPSQQRKWPRVLAGTVVLAAAAGTAVVVVRRRRRRADQAACAEPYLAAEDADPPGYRNGAADLADSQAQAEVNGQLQPS